MLRAEPAGPRRPRAKRPGARPRRSSGPRPGQRVALALPGVERSELRRGDALVAPGSLRPSYRLDVALEELEPIADGARLHVHHGTAAVPARVVRAGGYAQLRLAAPVVAARGDRVVLRDATTVGGGTVLDPTPARHADPARFEQASAARRAFTRRCSSTASGASRTRGSPSSGRAGARLDARRPARPRRARADRALGEGRARAAAVRAARLAALPARARPARSAPRAADAERAGGRARGGGARRGRRPRTPSSPASSSARAGSSGSATAGRSPRPPTSGRGRSCSRSAPRPGRSRSRASATSPAAAAATRSSCSSASTRDGVTRRVGDARVLRRRASAPAS